MPLVSNRRAPAAAPGLTTMSSGSNAAIALATPAYWSSASSMSCHTDARVGQAMRHRSCGSHSAGMCQRPRREAMPATLAEDGSAVEHDGAGHVHRGAAAAGENVTLTVTLSLR